MNRTIWLAAFCLAGLGGLCASKVTASIYPSEEATSEQSQIEMTVSDAIVSDTLTKSDKAEVTEPATADATYSLPVYSNDVTAARPTVFRSKHSVASSAHVKTVMLPRKRPKIKVAKNANQDNTATDAKTCSQSEGFGGLLKSIAGSHCS